MKDDGRGRQIYGSPSALKKAKADKKFPYVVALARAVNALNSAHSLMMSTNNRNTPEAMRDRMNGHFFVSGILYETLKLIRSMSSIFKGDQRFETSLRMVLKDASGHALEQMHRKSARHGGIFHFAADRFAEAIAKTPMVECVVSTRENSETGNSETDGTHPHSTAPLKPKSGLNGPPIQMKRCPWIAGCWPFATVHLDRTNRATQRL